MITLDESRIMSAREDHLNVQLPANCVLNYAEDWCSYRLYLYNRSS